jgi:hypothetical protein
LDESPGRFNFVRVFLLTFPLLGRGNPQTVSPLISAALAVLEAELATVIILLHPM